MRESSVSAVEGLASGRHDEHPSDQACSAGTIQIKVHKIGTSAMRKRKSTTRKASPVKCAMCACALRQKPFCPLAPGMPNLTWGIFPCLWKLGEMALVILLPFDAVG